MVTESVETVIYLGSGPLEEVKPYVLLDCIDVIVWRLQSWSTSRSDGLNPRLWVSSLRTKPPGLYRHQGGPRVTYGRLSSGINMSVTPSIPWKRCQDFRDFLLSYGVIHNPAFHRRVESGPPIRPMRDRPAARVTPGPGHPQEAPKKGKDKATSKKGKSKAASKKGRFIVYLPRSE